METPRLTFGSLFSGIGGLDLGLERSGMRCLWQVEIDEKCRRVLARHWPAVPRHGDIRGVGAHNLSPVDVLCGGFPCQPVSVAGKRQGQADDRWLWPEYARLVGELRPRYVLVENVPGLCSDEAAFGSVLGDLAALGYDAEWDCLPAALVGAPHIRYRIFLVAYPVGGRGPVRREAGDVAGPTGDPQGEEGERQRGGDAPDHSRAALAWGLQPECGWIPEPPLGRLAHGIPDDLDRLKMLGNAVVPQAAELVGRMIVRHAVTGSGVT